LICNEIRRKYTIIFSQKYTVNEGFIQIAKKGRTSEKRFRLFDKCVKGGGRQWKENRDRLIDNVVNNCNKKLIEAKQNEKVRACLIRENYR
jgi:hypothetical protein